MWFAYRCIAKQSKKAKQSKANKNKTSNYQTKVKQTSKPRKITSLVSSSQTRVSKLNTRNSTKRRRKALLD